MATNFIQRALSTWILSLLTLVFMVIYLDGGLSQEPLIFFALLLLMDALTMGTILMRCIRFYANGGVEERGFAVNDMPPLNIKWTIYSAVAIAAKAVFEVMLYFHLRRRAQHLQSLPQVWVLAPLWVFLSLVIGDLVLRVVEVHRKVA